MAHIDYLTITTRDAIERDSVLREIRSVRLNDIVEKQEFYGFRGLRWDYGNEGSRFLGVRDADDYVMISCTGRSAHTEAERLKHLPVWRPSRVDIALDICSAFDVKKAYIDWQGCTRTKLTAIEDETLYIGSRKSAIFWRIYNKAIEIGRPELSPLWRIELELKGERAQQFWKMWRRATESDIAGILKAYLRLPNGNPREPAHSLLGSHMESTEKWYVGTLPRRRRAGEEYLWNNVLPFLKDNWEWAGPIVLEQLRKAGKCT